MTFNSNGMYTDKKKQHLEEFMERRNFVCPHTLSYASTIGLCWRHNAELNGA